MRFVRPGLVWCSGLSACAMLCVGASLLSQDRAEANGLVGVRAHLVSTQEVTAPLPAAAMLSSGRAEAPARATSVRLDDGTDSASLTFDLSTTDGVSSSIVPFAFVLSNPDRIIVDLPRIDFAIDPQVGKLDDPHRLSRKAKDGLVGSYRFGLLSADRSRIVIDLKSPARVVFAAIRKNATGKTTTGTKLVIDLARTDRARFTAAASGRIAEPLTALPPVAATIPAKTTIVLDPGHGGPDTGAIVNGVVEKDVTLAFATKLAAKLEAVGGFNVVMTRASDVFIPLSERVHVARGAEAALMISIHADTLPETADVSGATVYTVSDKASDAYAAKVAAKENEADSSVGMDGQADTADVNDILFDLTRQETRAYSHVFARTLVNYWKVAGRLNKNPQRAAGFVVLKAPDVPSVLLELGYLSSPIDAAALTSDDWREKATGRMAEAIVAYFADRRGPEKAAAGVTMPFARADLSLGMRK